MEENRKVELDAKQNQINNTDVIDATIMGVYEIIQKYSKRSDMKEPYERIKKLKNRRNII